jgi:hypothetical protein
VHSATRLWFATSRHLDPIINVYSDSDESSHDSLDPIIDVLAKLQFKSYHDYSFVELLDNLRKVASIDDLPFQHGTPLTPIRETGSGGTELADYRSDLESYTPERLVSMINQQEGVLPASMTPVKLRIRSQMMI